jgi:hypothetical protein
MRFTIVSLSIICCLFFLSCQKDVAELINVPTHAVPTANAGPSLVVQLPISSITLIGTGSSQNAGIASVSWSFVTGPNIPTIITPGLRTTVVNGLIKGIYIFQFTVVDSAGFIGVDTATVTVKPDPNAPQTLDLFVTGNNNEQNFALFNGNNVNFQNIELLAYASPTGINFQRARGAFKFDLTAIPTSSTIISAKLSLFSNPTPINVIQGAAANFGTNNAFSVMRLRNVWNATTSLNQQTFLIDSSNVLSSPHTNLPILDVENIDVKPLVDSMRSQGNFGFTIALQNEFGTNCRNFASSTHPNTAKRPKLTVVYQ